MRRKRGNLDTGGCYIWFCIYTYLCYTQFWVLGKRADETSSDNDSRSVESTEDQYSNENEDYEPPQRKKRRKMSKKPSARKGIVKSGKLNYCICFNIHDKKNCVSMSKNA